MGFHSALEITSMDTRPFICISISFEQLIPKLNFFPGTSTDFRMGYANLGTFLACSNFCRAKSYGSLASRDHEPPTGMDFTKELYFLLSLMGISNSDFNSLYNSIKFCIKKKKINFTMYQNYPFKKSKNPVTCTKDTRNIQI